jgi:hypothetical protein
MSQTLEQQIQAGIQTVYGKATSDPVFRKLCVSNPNAAIKQALGLDVPAWAKVKMVDAEGANFTFILPEPPAPSGELKDEDLEHVAGGAAKNNMVISPGAGGGGGGAPPVIVGGPISGIPGNQKGGMPMGGGGGGGGGGSSPPPSIGAGNLPPGFGLNKNPK